MRKRTPVLTTERYRIQGHPEVSEDFVKMLKRASQLGLGTQVIRVSDGVMMAEIPDPNKRRKPKEETLEHVNGVGRRA